MTIQTKSVGGSLDDEQQYRKPTEKPFINDCLIQNMFVRHEKQRRMQASKTMEEKGRGGGDEARHDCRKRRNKDQHLQAKERPEEEECAADEKFRVGDDVVIRRQRAPPQSLLTPLEGNNCKIIEL